MNIKCATLSVWLMDYSAFYSLKLMLVCWAVLWENPATSMLQPQHKLKLFISWFMFRYRPTRGVTALSFWIASVGKAVIHLLQISSSAWDDTHGCVWAKKSLKNDDVILFENSIKKCVVAANKIGIHKNLGVYLCLETSIVNFPIT